MKCCVIGCPNQEIQNKLVSYHLFPHPTKERYRYAKWVEACNNPRLCEKTPEQIYRQFRICRRHFDDVCFNGACKRLLCDAIPTLHLNKDKRKTIYYRSMVPSDLIFERQKQHNFILSAEDMVEVLNSNDDDNNSEELNDFKLIPCTQDDDLTDGDVIEVFENDTIQRIEDATECDSSKEHKDSCGEDSMSHDDNFYDLIEVPDDASSILNSISMDDLKDWRKTFYSEPKNLLAQNACTKLDPFEVCLTRKALEHTNHCFNIKIETEGKPITQQKNSGRCWLFAALNCVRIPFSKKYNLEEFEFSQAYLFYWDKIERCHFFLNSIVSVSIRGEEVTGRLISFLLKNPTDDGGQWDMFLNLVNKYGLMPKKCFPDSHSCEASRRMNCILQSKLREYTKVLRDMIDDKCSPESLQEKIKEQMSQIYNIVGICLGIPDEQITWEYHDKNKGYHKIGPVTPLDFYKNYVKECFNVDDKVCIVNDPRKTSPFNELYTLDYLNNVVGGRPILYNNQPIEVLRSLVVESIKRNEPVWFGCDTRRRCSPKLSALDLKLHDFKLTFGVDIQGPLNKADRLTYGESIMYHTMVFTAVMCDDDGKVQKFRVENSHGEQGEKGYYVMSVDWFNEFVYEIVVGRAIVPKDILAVFEKVPVTLPPWDPMGTLAY